MALLWNDALLAAVRTLGSSPVAVARALAIAHTCMYDAWAAYSPAAVGTELGATLRVPAAFRSEAAKREAVSFAAYRALLNLFPSEAGRFRALMESLAFDPTNESSDVTTPAGVGNVACAAVLERREHDGANQLGDMNGGAPYSDYTGYVPANTADILQDPNRWQPLRTATGAPQAFLAPHWRLVRPFALEAPDQFRPKAPSIYPEPGYLRQVDEVVADSARLTDRMKVIAEYWADGPATETPPGHWALFGQYLSARDRHNLDADVQMFFALGNALLDASIAVWDCKVAFDYIRPVSAVRFVYAGQTIQAWAGPFLGTRSISGNQFQSYIPTPPFAEYTSGHSAFSAAAATVFRLFTGNPFFRASYTFPAGSSRIEPGAVPASDVTLSWRTFDEAADEAAVSRRYGGIHFRQGDLESRQIGRRVGAQAWKLAKSYIDGRADESARGTRLASRTLPTENRHGR